MILKWFKNRKISTRIALSYTIVFMALFIITDLLAFAATYKYAQHHFDLKFAQVEQWLETHKHEDFLLLLPQQQQDLSLYTNAVYLAMLFENGDMVSMSKDFDFKEIANKKERSVFFSESTNAYTSYKTCVIDSEENGLLVFYIAADLGGIIVFFRDMIISISIMIICAFSVALFVSNRIAVKALRPISDITEFTREINENSMEKRYPISQTKGEFHDLVLSINSLIDKIQASVESQILFVADASHELKTPTTAILGYVNLIERWGMDKRNVLETSINAIKRESIAMRDLIDKLLLLAKCDNGALVIEKEIYCISDIIGEVIEDARIIYPHHIFTASKAETAFLSCDYKLFKQLLRIFIDNSAKFTENYNKIDISAIVNGTMLEIVVSDSGYGISDEDQRHIFERFFCSEKSREKNKSGYGLGLPIAKKIIDLHNGTIEVASMVGIGTAIKITFPVEL